jgi:6-phosphogluconolactonase (cycloisomerase 2 family)
MKFSKLSQLFLVSSIGLLVATLLTACQLVSIDFLFVASSAGSGTNSNGQIDIFAVDSASGALRTIAPPVSSGGITPVALAVSASYVNLYAANQGSSNNIVHFAIDSNGNLTQKDVVSGLGTPTSIAVNQAGTYLYAVYKQTASATLTALPLASDGSITGTAALTVPLTIPGHGGDTVIPTQVIVLTNNNAVYVSAYDQSVYNPGGSITPNDNANPGWVFGFTVGSGGALTPTSGSPYQAGTEPSALAADPTNRFVYVTDFAQSQVIGYTIQSGSTLNFFFAPPTATGKEPSAITFDPRGKFVYITNELDSTVTAFAIDLATGAPTLAINPSNGLTNSTNTEPVAIVVDPALGRFVYTANYADNSISGFRLDPTAGSLGATQATPYPSGAQPTALACMPHGNHVTQSVTP